MKQFSRLKRVALILLILIIAMPILYNVAVAIYCPVVVEHPDRIVLPGQAVFAGAQIMVESKNYILTDLVSDENIGLPDISGIILCTTNDMSRSPERNNQSNFGYIFTPYAIIDGIVYILIDGSWTQCDQINTESHF